MARITVRKFGVANGLTPAVTTGAVTQVEVSLAGWVLSNAFALPHGPLTWLTVLHESRLVLSHFKNVPGRDLRLRPRFKDSSSTVRRFVSESSGLGLLAGVNYEVLGWRPPAWNVPVLHVDNLSPAHKPLYAKGVGPRPDLIFPVAGALGIGGEARGRAAKPSANPTMEQQRRLDSLAKWSADHGNAAWIMSWAFNTTQGTTVDLFDPGQPTRLLEEGVAETLQAKFEERFAESAPPDYQPFGRTQVRGQWTPLDLLAEPDEPTPWLYVGVLDEPVAASDVPLDFHAHDGDSVLVGSITTYGEPPPLDADRLNDVARAFGRPNRVDSEIAISGRVLAVIDYRNARSELDADGDDPE